MSYQDLTIVGNVGNRPSTREVNGKQVCNFSVAVNNYKGETEWFRVGAWGRLGEVCQQYIHKGKKVLVAGELRANIYSGRNGEPKIALNLKARTVKFLSKSEHFDSGDEPPF